MRGVFPVITDHDMFGNWVGKDNTVQKRIKKEVGKIVKQLRR